MQVITLKIDDNGRLAGASSTFNTPQTITIPSTGERRTIAPGKAVPIDADKLKDVLDDATAAAINEVDALTAKIAELQAEKTAVEAEFASYKKVVNGGTAFIEAKIADKSLNDAATVQTIAGALPQLKARANQSENERKLSALEQQAASLADQIEKQRAALAGKTAAAG